MIEIRVQLGQRSYPVRIGSWRDWDLRSIFASGSGNGNGNGHGKGEGNGLRGGPPWTLIADQKCWELWGKDLQACFGSAGIEIDVVCFGAGETAKSHDSLFAMYDHLLSRTVRRDGTIAIFGGGVLGDVGGFAAATYQRGIRYVQIPSTLLAQVDSSIGGKTGLNYGGYKNMVGSFHQPAAVLISPEWLMTLPAREFHAGLAEVIKCGVIRDPALLDILEELEPERILTSARLEEVIARAVAVKARIVEEDETDLGVRRLLNFGHTVGHAIEGASGFEQYLHGEAVSIGTVAALQLSVALAGLAPEEAARVERLLRKFDLPTRVTGVDPEKIIERLAMDKKADSVSQAWVLTPKIGTANVSTRVPAEQIRAAVSYVLDG